MRKSTDLYGDFGVGLYLYDTACVLCGALTTYPNPPVKITRTGDEGMGARSAASDCS